ncbi:MAG: SocA family protein [Planctomycetes bacterium]|nr:SocA family protein [Planctomycetota bacterium]
MRTRTASQDASAFTFDFDSRKAIEAAGFFLSRHGKKLNRFHLLKVLYLADRESIRKFHRPICGGEYVSMDYGPVLSRVYDLIKFDKHGAARADSWGHYFENHDFHVLERKAPGRAFLSKADLAILEAVDAKFGHMSFEDLLQYVHTKLPEWKDPSGSSEPIETSSLLKLFGLRPAEILEIGRHALAEREHRRLLTS